MEWWLIIAVVFIVVVNVWRTVSAIRTRRAVAKLVTRYPGYALITGASTGVGEKFALALATEGLKGIVLVATERSSDKLQAIKRVLTNIAKDLDVRTIVADLATPQGLERVFAETSSLPISILVNNAGFGLNGRFDKLDLDRQLAMVKLNCEAPLSLTHHFIRLRNQQYPNSRLAVIMMGSLAGLTPGIPFQTVYAASKSFLASLSRGLALEYPNVDIVLTEPGTMSDTNFQQTSGQPFHKGHITSDYCVLSTVARLKAHPGGLVEFVPGMSDNITSLVVKFLPTSLVLRFTQKRGKKYSPPDLL